MFSVLVLLSSKTNIVSTERFCFHKSIHTLVLFTGYVFYVTMQLDL